MSEQEELLCGSYKIAFGSHEELLDVLPILKGIGLVLKRRAGLNDERVTHLYLDSGEMTVEYYSKGTFENDSNQEISPDELYRMCGMPRFIPDFDQQAFEEMLAQ